MFNSENPRFVLNIGATKETHPDLPEHTGETVLWDRQEKKPVITIHGQYQSAICLETIEPNQSPFTRLEQWFNELSNESLESEGMAPTVNNEATPAG